MLLEPRDCKLYEMSQEPESPSKKETSLYADEITPLSGKSDSGKSGSGKPDFGKLDPEKPKKADPPKAESSPKVESSKSGGPKLGESKVSPVEVLSSAPAKMESGELVSSQPAENVRRSWMPWKRASRRDQQLAQLRDGYVELIGLIRNISGHLENQQKDSSQVATLVESLPPALNSFEKLANSQEQVTAILGRINSHMEDNQVKDQELLDKMQSLSLIHI